MPTAAASAVAADATRHSRHPTVLTGIFIGYVVLGLASFTLADDALAALPFRPASGLALAALVVYGLGAWPAVFVASFVVALVAAGDPLVSGVAAIGHTFGAVAGAALIERFADGRDAFRDVRSTLRGVFLILVSSGVPAALFIVTSVWQGGAAGGMWAAASGTWFGHATGAIAVAPGVLIVLTSAAPRVTREDWPVVAEGAALLASLGITALVVFAGFFRSGVQTYPLEFLCLPFLVWAAFRFSLREVALAVALLSSIAAWGTLHGAGPFADGSRQEAVWLLQAYIAVMSTTAIMFATAVGDRRRAEARLQELAMTDALTGLVNHRRLLDVLRLEMARSRRNGRPIAVLLIDTNGLKQINDRLGHQAGNRALCRIADVLRRSTRETDVVSRFGGDEFAVVLPESGADGARIVLERVSQALAADTATPVLSVSGGSAEFPRDGDSPTLLLRAADQQLNAAKDRGRVAATAIGA